VGDCGRGLDARLRRFAGLSGDRRQQLATMADRGDAEADQIIGC